MARDRRDLAEPVGALNFGDERAEVHRVDGVIALSTNRERDGKTVSGTVNLGAREGVVLDVTQRS